MRYAIPSAAIFLAAFLALFLTQAQTRAGTITVSGKDGWTAVMYGLAQDPQGDSQAKSADTDIVGGPSHGSLYVGFNDNGTATTADDYLYFRLRIDNPTATNNFKGVAVTGMDVNGDGRIDIFMQVDARNNGQFVRIMDPGTDLNTAPSTTSTSPLLECRKGILL